MKFTISDLYFEFFSIIMRIALTFELNTTDLSHFNNNFKSKLLFGNNIFAKFKIIKFFH